MSDKNSQWSVSGPIKRFVDLRWLFEHRCYIHLRWSCYLIPKLVMIGRGILELLVARLLMMTASTCTEIRLLYRLASSASKSFHWLSPSRSQDPTVPSALSNTDSAAPSLLGPEQVEIFNFNFSPRFFFTCSDVSLSYPSFFLKICLRSPLLLHHIHDEAPHAGPLVPVRIEQLVPGPVQS